MKDAINKLTEKLVGWGEGLVLMLPNLAVAIFVAIGFFFVAKYGRKIIRKLMGKVSDNQGVNRLMSNIGTAIIGIVGLFVALGILELDKTVTSLLAGAGVVGLAIGLAFQEPILNIFSGITMSIRKIVQIGDHIETNGIEGTVDKINLREVRLKLFTGEEIIIPNKMIIQNPLKNFTVNGERRLDLSCGVSYNDDLERVQEIAIQAIEESDVDHDEKKPLEVFYEGFGDSSINFQLRIWLNLCDKHSYLKSRSQAIISMKKAFDKEGINIPFPIRTLDFPLKKELSGLSLVSDGGDKSETSNQEGSMAS